MQIVVDKEIYEMTPAELDDFPLGVIQLDPSGTVVYYNEAENVLTRRAPGSTVGLNFFRDVAPCTAVREFQGRFTDFVERRESLCEEFRFVFRFAWGDREVGIILVRQSPDDERIFLVVNAYGAKLVVMRAGDEALDEPVTAAGAPASRAPRDARGGRGQR